MLNESKKENVSKTLLERAATAKVKDGGPYCAPTRLLHTALLLHVTPDRHPPHQVEDHGLMAGVTSITTAWLRSKAGKKAMLV